MLSIRFSQNGRRLSQKYHILHSIVFDKWLIVCYSFYMKETQVAYLAGFFDGEGSIGIYLTNKKYHSYTMVARIVQKNPLPLKQFPSTGKIYLRKDGVYMWQIYSEPAAEFLELILPFLLLKRDKAIQAIEFQKTKRKSRRVKRKVSQEEAYKQLLQALKLKGKHKEG